MKFIIHEKDVFQKSGERILEETSSYAEAQRRVCALKATNPRVPVYVSIEYPKCKTLYTKVDSRH
jgi:hypothetical protein